MDYTETLSETFENNFSNSCLVSYIVIFTIMFLSLSKDNLPSVVRQTIDNDVMKISLLMLILYLSKNNLQLGIFASIIYIFVIQRNSLEKKKENFQSKLNYFSYN